MNNSETEIKTIQQISKPWDLPWQTQAWNEFSKNFTEGRLHHAWIIEGDADYDIEGFVVNITQLVNCDNVENGTPCGSCIQCTQIASGHYADFIKVSLLEKKIQIGIDQIRDINKILTQKAYSGRYRVVTIEQAELLNTASANAFLKTLEEPGEKTLLLLQTLYPSRLLATLRSRCQQLSFTSTKPHGLIKWLNQQLPNSTEESQQLALEAAGYKPLLALSFIQNKIVQQRQLFFKALDDLFTRRIKLSQFEKQHNIENKLMLAWLEHYLFKYFSENHPNRHHLESFYSVLQESRLQSVQARDADKPLLLREILIKWIALFTKLSHS
jgi:DNA polymerase-3 subunit delta'